MFIKQLSVFVENKHGRLEAIINALGEKGVNISALSIAETSEFGVLRLIVDDVDKAKACLNEIGVISRITDVIAPARGGKAGHAGYDSPRPAGRCPAANRFLAPRGQSVPRCRRARFLHLPRLRALQAQETR